MSIEAVALVSACSTRGDQTLLESELARARRLHAALRITGATLHHDGSLFHYLEGEPDDLAAAVEGMAQSGCHRGLTEISRESLPRRHFSAWTMGQCVPVDSSALDAEQGRWLEQLVFALCSNGADDGMSMLMDFWNRHVERDR